MRLKGKVAVVTGGARDIGREVSIKLASEGASVVINYMGSSDQAAETLSIIEKNGGKAVLMQGDMTKSESVQQLVTKTTETFGNEIHILVNVAGGLIARKTLDDMDEEFWDRVMNVNLRSVFLLTKYIVPHMPSGSSIVNFSSQAARDGGGFGASAYATAKGAIATFTRSMAKELGPKGIRVNALTPGMIATKFHDEFTKPEVRTAVAGMTPLRREGKANEVADLVCYLAGDSASFLTGANVDINGGTYFS